MIRSRWVPAVVWAGLIVVATSLPNTPAGPEVTGLDKVVHLGLYGVLGALTLRAAVTGHPALGTMLVWLGAIAAFAAVDEWHQAFIPNRSADVIDWAADVAGAALGIASMAALKLRRHQRT